MFGKELIKENASFLYKYKGYVPVGILGQIDDIIGVSEAGYKAHQLNSSLNVKTADKYLQFGRDKCGAMVVGKKQDIFHIPNMHTDTWDVKHDTGGTLVEVFSGKLPMNMSDDLTYLGVILSLVFCDLEAPRGSKAIKNWQPLAIYE